MQYSVVSEARIPELVELWNQEIGTDFPMTLKLFTQNSLHDTNIYYPASILAIDHGKVVGFIISKVWQEKIREVNFSKDVGWIQVLLVDQRYRHKDIGTNLLNQAEDALREAGVRKVLIGRDPWHYFPGIPLEYKNVQEWLERKGYTTLTHEYDLTSTEDTLKNLNLPSLPNVSISLLTTDKKVAFLDFLHQCFPGRWEYEAIHYFRRGGTGREFVIFEKEKRIIGFCRINDSASPYIAQNVYWAPLFSHELGGIGPLGIDPQERGHGYGLAIVWAGVYYLHERGIRSFVIDWTALVLFYKKLGFKVWKSYKKYEKELQPLSEQV
jgi:GNAT superfamily N-acetyltransferase